MKLRTWYILMIAIAATTRFPLVAGAAASPSFDAAHDGSSQLSPASSQAGPTVDANHSTASSRASIPGGSPRSDQRLLPGPFAVGRMSLTLIDASRPTPANRRYQGAPARHLKTTVWYPARRRRLEALNPTVPPVASEGGPFPLVIYSHGFMSFRSEGSYLARHLASHGYIVVAASYPLTNYFAPGKPTIADVVNQPGDVQFLIDTVLAWSADPSHHLARAVDADRIAVAGLSLGGMTSTLTAFHPRLRDPRIRLAVSIAGPSSMFGAPFYQTTRIPYLMVAGDIDAIVDYEANAAILKQRAPDAMLITLRGACHTSFAAPARWLFRWHHNADSVGCRQIHKNLPTSWDFLGPLGGEADGLVDPSIRLPCRDPKLPRALRPTRQHTLVTLTVSSFLDAYFAGDASRRGDARRFLWQQIEPENPEVQVSGPPDGLYGRAGE